MNTPRKDRTDAPPPLSRVLTILCLMFLIGRISSPAQTDFLYPSSDDGPAFFVRGGFMLDPTIRSRVIIPFNTFFLYTTVEWEVVHAGVGGLLSFQIPVKASAAKRSEYSYFLMIGLHARGEYVSMSVSPIIGYVHWTRYTTSIHVGQYEVTGHGNGELPAAGIQASFSFRLTPRQSVGLNGQYLRTERTEHGSFGLILSYEL